MRSSREHAPRIGTREGLEDGLDLVVIGAAVHCFDVDVGPGAAREAVEEVGQQFGLEVADQGTVT